MTAKKPQDKSELKHLTDMENRFSIDSVMKHIKTNWVDIEEIRKNLNNKLKIKEDNGIR